MSSEMSGLPEEGAKEQPSSLGSTGDLSSRILRHGQMDDSVNARKPKPKPKAPPEEPAAVPAPPPPAPAPQETPNESKIRLQTDTPSAKASAPASAEIDTREFPSRAAQYRRMSTPVPDDGPLKSRLRTDYQLVKLVGYGATGEIWHAINTNSYSNMAAKLLRSHISKDPDAVAAFYEGMNHASKLAHQNIAQIHEYGEDNGQLFYVMEWSEGESLREKLHRGGSMLVSNACDILVQVVAALRHAHIQGMTHGNVKPENIMVAPDGRVKLTDFGMGGVTALQKGAPILGPVKSQSDYTPPEKLRAEALDHRSDIYSLGATLLEMLGVQISSTEPVVIPSWLKGFQAGRVAALAQLMVAYERESRFKDYEELSKALARLDPKYVYTPTLTAALREAPAPPPPMPPMSVPEVEPPVMPATVPLGENCFVLASVPGEQTLIPIDESKLVISQNQETGFYTEPSAPLMMPCDATPQDLELGEQPFKDVTLADHVVSSDVPPAMWQPPAEPAGEEWKSFFEDEKVRPRSKNSRRAFLLCAWLLLGIGAPSAAGYLVYKFLYMKRDSTRNVEKAGMELVQKKIELELKKRKNPDAVRYIQPAVTPAKGAEKK